MPNEEIAKELLSVLKEKMMYREGLPSDGWAVEMICNALVASQQTYALDGAYCTHCECNTVYDGCCITCMRPASPRQ
jgi:hypothetical protein